MEQIKFQYRELLDSLSILGEGDVPRDIKPEDLGAEIVGKIKQADEIKAALKKDEKNPELLRSFKEIDSELVSMINNDFEISDEKLNLAQEKISNLSKEIDKLVEENKEAEAASKAALGTASEAEKEAEKERERAAEAEAEKETESKRAAEAERESRKQKSKAKKESDRADKAESEVEKAKEEQRKRMESNQPNEAEKKVIVLLSVIRDENKDISFAKMRELGFAPKSKLIGVDKISFFGFVLSQRYLTNVYQVTNPELDKEAVPQD